MTEFYNQLIDRGRRIKQRVTQPSQSLIRIPCPTSAAVTADGMDAWYGQYMSWLNGCRSHAS